MSVRRRDAVTRKTLFRDCFVCGKHFSATAETPFVRQITNINGKKQATVYFCSEGCKRKSYKHLFDGKADQRRKEREEKRDVREKNRKYYLLHSEQIKAKNREEYHKNREEYLLDQKYNRRKRKLIKEDCFCERVQG